MSLRDLAPIFSPTSIIAVLVLVALLAVAGVLSPRRYARFQESLKENPQLLSKYYWRLIANMWALAAIALLTLPLSPELRASDLGLQLPAGPAAIDYLLTAFVLGMFAIKGVQARRRVLNGQIHPLRARTAALLPTTAGQRLLAVAVSFSAGVTEEIVYRGLLIAAGVGVLGLPVYTAALLALVVFALMHAYQGKLGALNSGLIGLMLTAIYLLSGSLLLPMVIHIALDLIALLMIPRGSPAVPDSPAPEEPAIAESDTVTIRPASFTG